jgi:YD repeat-containing protein
VSMQQLNPQPVENDRLETLTDTGGSTTRVTEWTYLDTGEFKTITTEFGTPNATILTFGYDDARRLISITDSGQSYRLWS